MPAPASIPYQDEITVILDPPGAEPVELTPRLDSLRWTTSAIGGFGSLECDLPGWPALPQLELATIRLALAGRVLWEGRVEDRSISLTNGQQATRLQAFGLQRLLDDTAIRNTWVKRDFDWISAEVATGANVYYDTQIGRYDSGDLTKVGIRISGRNGGLLGAGDTRRYIAYTLRSPAARIKFTCAQSGDTRLVGYFAGYDAAGVLVQDYILPAGTTLTVDNALGSTVATIWFGTYIQTAYTPIFSDIVEIYDIRVVGLTAGQEDAPGGVYAGTVIRDVVNLVPGLTNNGIDAGGEFLIDQVDKDTPVSARSIVEEMAAFHTREWAVWEEGAFTWREPPLDDPHWIVPTDELLELELTASVANLARDTVVVYEDPATSAITFGAGAVSSVTQTATDRRNPYVRTGTPKDDVISVGFPMTSRSAGSLAAKLNAINGTYPPVTGRVTLPADATIRSADGGVFPSWAIRAGENILIPDLPVTEPQRRGRDGQTLFHTVTVDASLADGTVQLALEGQSRRSDVLLARLAAATRTLTG